MSVSELRPSADEAPAPNVIEALRRVIRDLPGIGKGNRSEQGYSYRGIEAVAREVQPLLARHGVVYVPRVEAREEVALTINGKPWTEQRLTVAYDVFGPGGREDRITVGPIVAQGRDNSDKGCNKAMTQAFKYALLQTLCISDAKDDGDLQTHEADAPPVVVPWNRNMVKAELLDALGKDKDAATAAWEWASGDALTEWSEGVGRDIALRWEARPIEDETVGSAQVTADGVTYCADPDCSDPVAADGSGLYCKGHEPF